MPTAFNKKILKLLALQALMFAAGGCAMTDKATSWRDMIYNSILLNFNLRLDADWNLQDI